MKRIFYFIILMLIVSCKKEDSNPKEVTKDRTPAIFNPSKTYDTMTDQEGNMYKTITIGTQTWMAENLKTTKYNDGSVILIVADSIAWESLLSGAYCTYKSTSDIDFIATYGRLYNWYALNTGKLAPQGWHVPSRDEYKILINYLGGDTIAGGKLKETGSTHWTNPNVGATNESGFTALPSGYRGQSGMGYTFQSLGNGVSFWTSYNDGVYAYGIVLRNIGKKAETYVFNKNMGFPLRLIKD